MRRAAAIAVGYSQDELLLPILEMLLADAEANVRDHAARSLLSFGNRAQPLLENHVSSPYRTIFVNTLARQNPAQYLTELATIIERDGAAGEFGSIVPSGEVAIGGRVLASESWSILFDYVRHRPSSELADGTLERWLDALEKLRWRSSSEPQRLYALYMNHGLNDRAARFREAVTRSARFDMEPIFDRVDRNPAMFLH